jgi:hypothetical protein
VKPAIVKPPASPAGGKGTVDLFGHKVSWDAIMIAGVSLVAAIFLFRVGQPSSSGSSSVAPLTGGGIAGGGAGSQGIPGTAGLPGLPGVAGPAGPPAGAPAASAIAQDPALNGHQADPGFHFGGGMPTIDMSWAWKVPGSNASVIPQFGATPSGPGAQQYGWEWAALQIPGDLLSFPGGPHWQAPLATGAAGPAVPLAGAGATP